MGLTPADMPAVKRIEYGVAWMRDALEISAKDEQRPLLHQALAREMEQILTQKDIRYLGHEYLEANNEPLLFRDFLAQAGEAGLAYLGDAEPASMIRHISNPALREFFRTHPASSMAESEQSIDIIMGRTFRQSLLVKGLRSRQINRALTSGLFKSLHVQARISKKAEPDGQVAYMHPRAGKINAQPPYGTAAMEVVAGATVPTGFGDLAEKFVELSNGGEGVFADALFSLLGAGVIDIFADPLIADQPKGASRLAVLDIASGRHLTVNWFGEAIALDPAQMMVLPLMAGVWSRDDLVAKLEAMYAKGAFNVEPAPQGKEQLRAVLSSMADQAEIVLKTVGLVG
jgi:hypothetical protein